MTDWHGPGTLRPARRTVRPPEEGMFVGWTRADIRVIVFDWGGTLCDVRREGHVLAGCAEAAVVAARRAGLPVSAEAAGLLLDLCRDYATRQAAPPEYREYDACAVLAEWLRDTCGATATDDGTLDGVVATFWRRWIGCLDPYDGVVQTMERLAGVGYVLGLMSNTASPAWACEAELKRQGIDPYLRFREFSSRLGRRKPHPAVYEAIMAHARVHCPGLAPGKVLFVGDTPEADIAGPARAGMRTALVGPAEPPADVRPDVRVAAVPDLLNHLEV